ncbi:hypothetical protein CC2G_009075 [Coprinopsis cinerea AmutBmut pab1-1]|nr:hypothetical protein CC2G_009075 [Coprinopsis cinerea AmutBmut pab1-1]
MLPAPATESRKRSFRRLTSPRKRVLDSLLARSRATNLAVLILSAICLLSLVLNVHHQLGSTWARSSEHTAIGLFSTITRHRKSSNLNHLVVVPCHAIWKGVDAASRLNEDDWILEHYQKGTSQVDVFFRHIVEGAKLAKKDTRSLLVFSGGQTRPASTTTEAESYLRLAISAKLLDEPDLDPVSERVTTENHALDSYQNLVFSIARFHEFTGVYPEHITVVGYDFKRARFTDLHRKALRWPVHRFGYIGVDPDDDQHNAIAREGELKNGYQPYSVDLYGCHSFLLGKRRQRNPFSRFHSYYTSAPELAPLFDWCPDSDGLEDSIFRGSLPWNRD